MSFAVHLKKVFKQSAIYGVGGALSRVFSVITAPILTHAFTPSDYGLISLLQAAVTVFIMFAGMNLNSAVFYYYYKYDSSQAKIEVLSSGAIFYTVLSLLFSVLLWGGAPYVEDLLRASQADPLERTYSYAEYLRILAIGMFFSLMETNFRSLLRMTNQPYKYVAMCFLQVASNLLFVVLFVVYMDKGLEGAMWAYSLSCLLTAVVGYMMVFQYYKLIFSSALVMMLVTYALPAFPSLVLNWGLMQANRFFINYYSPLEQQGFYSIALQISMIVMVVTTAFRTAYDPLAYSIMKRPDAQLVFARLYTVFVVGFGVFSACFSLFSSLFIWLFAPESYYEAHTMVFVLVFAVLFQGANNILATGMWLTEKLKYTSYCQAIAFAVNTLLNFLLIPKYMAMGAALAFLGGALAQSLSYYFFAQRLYSIPYRYWRLLGFVGVMFCFVGIFTFMLRGSSLQVSCGAAVVFVPVLVSIGWFFGFNERERDWGSFFIKGLKSGGA